MLRRLLVANRGEIALRIVRAARALGIETVLAASAADKDSAASREADRTLILGAAAARESYLHAERIVHAAKASGCDALHPGYGFLSERPTFARLCEDHGIVFVGPAPDTMERVGGKIAARELALAAGVPLVPGSGALDSATDAVRAADKIGYPVVTKASAGGGGRGMTVVHDPREMPAAFDRASAEARAAFGDGTLFLERYIDNARHIEVQALGDGQGRVVHFGERDCSSQRRYQKMVEEAPAAILDPELRVRVHTSAIQLLSSVRYRNAGTVEFLYDEERRAFYFIEVNARIQVEHPVSEAITGVDLIQLQLRLAAGEAPPPQSQVRISGHAIEMRVLAEDPDRDFAPSPGRITRWQAPQGAGVRLDTAMHENVVVPPWYDSMIAKLVVHGSDRADAVERLRAALDDFRIEGIATNLPLLRFVARHGDFVANRISTRWLEQTLLPAYAPLRGN